MIRLLFLHCKLQYLLACIVMVDNTDGEAEYDMVAAHTTGGNQNILLNVPTTLSQAMAHEDSEFWNVAILDEITNYEEIFQAFGPAIPKQPGMRVTPTRFFVFFEVCQSR